MNFDTDDSPEDTVIINPENLAETHSTTVDRDRMQRASKSLGDTHSRFYYFRALARLRRRGTAKL